MRLRVDTLQNELFATLFICTIRIVTDTTRPDWKQEGSIYLSGFTSYRRMVIDKRSTLTRVYNDRKFREWGAMQQELKRTMKPAG